MRMITGVRSRRPRPEAIMHSRAGSKAFALSREIAQFTQVRLQEDMAAWSTLATCRSPEQAMDCQHRFVAKMSDQYSAEIAKLSRMMMNIAGQGLSFAQQRSTHDARPAPNSHPEAH